MTGRRFMDGASLWERQPFVSLGQQTPVVVPPVVVAPTPGPIVIEDPARDKWKLGTIAATVGLGFLALEVVGVTNVLGIRKYMK